MNFVTVTGVSTEGILKLLVTRPTHLGHPMDGQVEVQEFHITLVRLDELGVDIDAKLLPKLPQQLGLENQLLFVDSGTKQSCFFNLLPEDQAFLKLWLRKVEFIMERPLIDLKRVFHVTVSNAGQGEVRQSVGSPWEYIPHPM